MTSEYETHLMITPVDVGFGTGILVGVGLCGLGYYSYRECDELGVTAFAAFAFVLGLSAVLGSATGLVGVEGPTDIPLWPRLATMLWGVAALPWAVFAAQYSGRYVQVGRRTVGLLAAPYLGLVVGFWLLVSGSGSIVLSTVMTSLVLVYSLALILVGVYLLIRATYRYGGFSAWQGVTMSVAPLGTLVALNSVSIIYPESEQLALVLFVGILSVVLVALTVAVSRQDVFESSPAVGTLGERTVLRETDDVVLVVDDRDKLVSLNEAAVETLGVGRPAAFERPLSSLIGHGTETLQSKETVSLDTTDGTRRYDPQVAVLSRRGRELGALLSLRDVTARELREQRLSVLNRVLRHNLRNKLEVVKTHTEIIHEELDGEYETHTETLAETTDDIADLGRNARRIDQFVASDSGATAVDIVSAIEETLAAVDTDDTDVDITVDAPVSAPVETNRRALTAALRSALENAVTYAETAAEVTVERDGTDWRVLIVDDGPGIPSSELDSLDDGVETPLSHGTGLGLWQLKWAVTTLGGQLSFDTADGTTVEMTVPDRSQA